MEEFEIWSEGFAVTGQSGEAMLMGRAKGESFEDACADHFDPNDPNDSKYYDPKRNTYWGCRLFDNEADARKSFG